MLPLFIYLNKYKFVCTPCCVLSRFAGGINSTINIIVRLYSFATSESRWDVVRSLEQGQSVY